MPRKLKSNISGVKLIKFFETNGFEIKRTKGSHIVLIRKILSNDQILVIPKHKTVPRGTLKAIYRQATQYISEEILSSQFYSD